MRKVNRLSERCAAFAPAVSIALASCAQSARPNVVATSPDVVAAQPSPGDAIWPGDRATSSEPPTAASDRPAPAGERPSVCAAPWALGVIGGEAQVVVFCPGDVQRKPLDPSGPMAAALAPALDPARDRVCSCAARMQPPPAIDLVFTAKGREGRVTVEAKDDDDPEGGAAFADCVGTPAATFAPAAADVCPAGAPATLVYPVRLELAPR